MSISNYPHPVFVVDVQYNGYGIARSFLKHGIKVVGFFPRGACYESLSRLFHKFVYLDGDENNYLKILLETANPFMPYKPVLIITSDLFQDFIHKFSSNLKDVFIFEIPPYEILKVFIEKDLFKELAVRLNVNIPFSYEINRVNANEVLVNSTISFPLIIKPKYRDHAWVEKYPNKKVFVASNLDELWEICNNLFELADRLILQEWIPGPDSNIYYCMTYIKPNGEVLNSFCGRKIHQYPILLGSTSSAEPADEPSVVSEALRILTQNGNYGFCSVEFKKHNENGKFYVIEPTVGRINQQEYTAALDGKDIVLDGYCDMLGISDKLIPDKVGNYYYIDDIMELQSIFEYRYFKRFRWLEYFKVLRKHKVVFMYINKNDFKLSLKVFIAMIKHIIYFLLNGRAKYKSDDKDVLKLINTFKERPSKF